MGSITVVKDQLFPHFSHGCPLSLVYFQQPNHKNENSNEEDENEEKDDVVEEVRHGGQCGMCEEQIWSFHVCYYYCKSCDYSLHKFCAELPMTLQNNPSHPDHNLELHTYKFEYKCNVCNLKRKNAYFSSCNTCYYFVDIACATMSEQKINHPSHRHQLERMFGQIVSSCVACGNEHRGVFFQCITCPIFRINLQCAWLPTKLLIQVSTNGNKFYPRCRVCDDKFEFHLWIYKCDKCRYYVHVDCATSKREPYMSIFLPASAGNINKNYTEDEHPNLLHCPFQDEGDNLLKHHMSNQKGTICTQHDGEMLNLSCHQHSLILFNKQTSVDEKMVSLHDPMKRVQLLCDGCVKPIMTAPFYMCCKYVDEQCSFVLHEWCANLPSQIQDYFDHPKHPLVLLPKIPSKFFGVFGCEVCKLPSNGFAYGCRECEYYVDINCAFIPNEITHEAHPGHFLLKVKPSTYQPCKACHWPISDWGFHCPTCDFYIHAKCALLLPREVKHKLDKHPLSLRYEPAENHIEEYFCESMHPACAPLILQSQCEQATYGYYGSGVYEFLNMKFGGKIEIKDHPHPLSFVQGIQSDGYCSNCREEDEYDKRLKYKMIFKCLECEFAIHYKCASFLFAN
ncbi:hypothetical protein M8C21_009880 [Ambrosia artemisiifolia]|uniref:Phorbol-ester/DAG-type domain-containing protein n=1 Tax=Ambrosia artemisiifolia TaxID=4212 RepID=A0AAD5DBU4_AMBAR|nr:hypothetical protein M8C21_009880 [Ambrosia artemisiifolia]